MRIPLSDGTRLAARLWLPEDAEADPVPAIVEYIPYRQRDGTAGLDALTHPYFAGHGYASLRVDIRGSGDSEGLLADEYLKLEQDDALEVLAWLAAQPWCTGAVGMIGISWGGFAALQIAARRPPELKAIVTVCSTDDRYGDDVHWMGGSMLTDNVSWGAGIFGVVSRPPDPEIVGDAWRDMWRQRLEANSVPLAGWLEHQRRDDFWRHGSVSEDYGAIDCAVYAVGGWIDGYTNAIFRLMANLAGPRQALVGPWTHVYPHLGMPEPAIGFLQDCLGFWDRWLKGVETEGEAGEAGEAGPMLRLWLAEDYRPDAAEPRVGGRWVGLPGWPPEAPQERVLWLNPGRLDPEAGPEMRLDHASPLACGLAGGEWCPRDSGGYGPEFQLDQREDDGRSLTFDSAPLSERVEILGHVNVNLELAADRPQAMLAVRLCDVGPDGRSARVTFGLLNLCHRHGHAAPEAVKPGERMRITLALKVAAYAFPPGHRIRLAVSSSYWPMAWPSPEPVTLSLFAGASSVSLPLAPAAAMEELGEPFGPPECAPPLATTQLEPGEITRTLTRDQARGRLTLTQLEDGGLERLDGIDLEMHRVARETYQITEGDPHSARMTTTRRFALRRGDWRVSTDERLEFSCDGEAFIVEAELIAFEGEERLFSRRWSRRIARDHM